jgi:hypothetical protein
MLDRRRLLTGMDSTLAIAGPGLMPRPALSLHDLDATGSQTDAARFSRDRRGVVWVQA